MRVVHELNRPCQVAGSGKAYAPGPGDPVSNTFMADVLITTTIDPKDYMAGDSLYIEGDAVSMLKALEQAALYIRAVGAEFVADGRVASNWHDFDTIWELQNGFWHRRRGPSLKVIK